MEVDARLTRVLSAIACVPPVAVATELYQLTLELCRAHPDDPSWVEEVLDAWALLDHAWKQHHAAPVIEI